MSTENNPLVALSEALADAVEKASAYTLLVDARRRLPASGIAYAADLVITADHAVEREEDIRILLPDGELIPASLAGRDPGHDLALLRVKGAKLNPPVAAPSPARLGQIVLAIGRPSEQGLQASLGVLSAIGGPVRTVQGSLLEQYLRTDAIPYPGFSGGPLIDAEGKLLGVNTSGAARGASLAIPQPIAWHTADTLARFGYIRRGYLGIRSQSVELGVNQRKLLRRDQSSGLLLVGIEDESPAAQADLLVGDILVGLGGEQVYDPDQLLTRLSGDTVGTSIAVEILRGEVLTNIEVKIGERK